jgi:F-box/TPR repeat protein Pof3
MTGNNVCDFTKWTQLESLNLSHNTLTFLPPVPPTIRSLDFSGTFNTKPIVMSLDMEPLNLPHLESFKCVNSTSLEFYLILQHIHQASQAGVLKTLHIGGQWDKVDVDDFPPCDSLTDLGVTVLQWENFLLVKMVKRYPKLRRLNVSGTYATGVLVKEAMTMESGPLEWLKIVDCGKMGTDAVDWARSMGTKVEYSLSNLYETQQRRRSGEFL